MTAARAFRRLALSAALLLCAAAPSRARAQGWLTGRVTGPAGEPVPSAFLRLTAADGASSATTRSGADGGYRIPFPGTGTRFSLWIERLGYAPATAVIERAPGASAARDVRLAVATTQLAPIEARAAANPYTGTRVAPGSRPTALAPGTVEALPLDPGDLGGFALRRPGAVPGAGGEGASAVSIAGQDPSQNRTVADGASFGGASLPAEAVRTVGVTTSTYDVARGQFTGGQVAVTTQRGGDRSGGALSIRGRGPFPWGAPAGSGWETGTAFVSGGYGGAIRPGRLFAFGATQGTRRWAPFASLADADAATLRSLGVDPDSVRRLEDVLRRVGAPAGIVPSGANTDAGSALLRLDWTASRTHALTLRLDARGTRADGPGSPLAWAGRGGERSSADGGVLLAWSARWAPGAANELRAYATAGRSRAAPFLDAPSGTVRVASAGEGVAFLDFGADPFRSSGRRWLRELSDDLQLPLAGGGQQLKLGFTWVEEATSLSSSANEAGAWTFNTLADLEAGTPALYTRTLASVRREATARYGAAYVGHGVQLARDVSLAYGVRAEAFAYDGRDGGSDASVLGVTPGRVPSRFALSPRVGFTWETAEASLRGGVGRFFGRAPLTSLAFALAEDGTQPPALVCAGPAAPRPDWPAYAAHPDAAPAACADGAPVFAQSAPAVTGFGAYTPPYTWRGSLEGSWNPGGSWILGAAVTLARGGGEPLAFDRNLVATPAFALAAEGGRPVYVAPSAIDPATGAVAPGASRVDPAFATVREVRSTGRSGATQLTLSLSRRWGSRILSPWYTWTDAWNERAALGALGSAGGGTAGDPRVVERAPADFARRHSFGVTLTSPLGRSLSLGVIGRLVSGLPYTPLVDGDVNGDGTPDDRAFVALDGELAGAMRDLAASAPSGAGDCLRAQAGRVAARNSCRGPWLASLDAQLTLSPGGAGADRRVRMRIAATNLAGAADWLLHGSDGLHGWGQMLPPDPTLLYVRGFDPAARAFRYEVNPRFGRSMVRPQLPFGLTVEARVRLGADPARQWLAEVMAANRLISRPPSQIAAALAVTLPNVPAEVLAAADSARVPLSDAQRERLRGQANALRMEIDSLIAVIAPAASAADTATADRQMAEMRRLTASARALIARATADAQAVLTPEQWQRLPAAIRERSSVQPIVPPKPLIIEMSEP